MLIWHTLSTVPCSIGYVAGSAKDIGCSNIRNIGENPLTLFSPDMARAEDEKRKAVLQKRMTRDDSPAEPSYQSSSNPRMCD
jgi:hypothetical protein